MIIKCVYYASNFSLRFKLKRKLIVPQEIVHGIVNNAVIPADPIIV